MYTTVIGVDASRIHHLRLVWPTWVKHKPSLLKHPLLVFFDSKELRYEDVRSSLIGHPDVTYQPWPADRSIKHKGDPDTKWFHPQRYKMLAGFVHVPPLHVKTKYWLKLDVDTVATGNDDWVDPAWFDSDPAVISHPWGYTKPAKQMLQLDDWFNSHSAFIADGWQQRSIQPSLHLVPNPGSSMVKHKRIISWCSFWNINFTKMCSEIAEWSCGRGQLPVPSQDGYLWYMAKRLNWIVRRENMKSRGWEHKSTLKNIKRAADKALR